MSEITKSDGKVMIRPGKNVVSSTVDEFRAELLSLINENNCELVIDLTGVQKIDSYGIGVFIAIYNALSKKEKKLVITNASGPIFAILKTMGLRRWFTIHPSDSIDRTCRSSTQI